MRFQAIVISIIMLTGCAERSATYQSTNNLCPVCGAAVNSTVPTVTASGSESGGVLSTQIGTCGSEHRELVAQDRTKYARAAKDNRTVSRKTP